MRNATCLGTKTSKVPTRVAYCLFILYTVMEPQSKTYKAINGNISKNYLNFSSVLACEIFTCCTVNKTIQDYIQTALAITHGATVVHECLKCQQEHVISQNQF